MKPFSQIGEMTRSERSLDLVEQIFPLLPVHLPRLPHEQVLHLRGTP
jgi:hypothetical protein